MKISLIKHQVISDVYTILIEAETVQDGMELGKLSEYFYNNNIEYNLFRTEKTLSFKTFIEKEKE